MRERERERERTSKARTSALYESISRRMLRFRKFQASAHAGVYGYT